MNWTMTFFVVGVVAAQSLTAHGQGASSVSATVKKVDESAEKITLEHAKIPNLDMDAMTMVFKVGDKAMLKSVKPGDRVRFNADRVNGQLTVTRIEKLR